MATSARTAAAWLWQDPFTGLYTWYQQRKLSSSLEHQFADPVNRIRLPHVGQAIGRIEVPRLGLHMVLVHGTDDGSLKKGPGRDQRTFMPASP